MANQQHDTSTILLTALPVELIERVMECLLPRCSLINELTKELSLNTALMESRTALSNVCLASRMLRTIASRYLYHTVILQDQRELFYFSRTLAATPGLRPLVRSLAWFGVLSESDPHVTSQVPPRSSQGGWSTPDVDTEPEPLPQGLAALKALEAVLIMIPKLKKLFTRVSHYIQSQSIKYLFPEYLALHRVFDGRAGTNLRPFTERNAQDCLVEQSQIHTTAGIASPHRFLQELETIIIEPHSSSIGLHRHILLSAISNCPSLKRIEVKGRLWLPSPSKARNRSSTPPLFIAENIKEISLRELETPKDMSYLSMVFPNLTMLSIELQDGAFQDPVCPDRLSKALLRLRHTLRTLCLTTTRGNSWSHFQSPPLLSPTLKDMQALVELTTECIWLFEPRSDALVSLELEHLLPPSLVDFHLIDYWGIHYPTEFYENVPAGMTPMECREKIFWSLHRGCSTHLLDLRKFKYTSVFFEGLSSFSDGKGESSKDVRWSSKRLLGPPAVHSAEHLVQSPSSRSGRNRRFARSAPDISMPTGIVPFFEWG
ncbi:hypothetical protein K449DRAFT_427552 [Hypoxylon sp. EC38]|nr:hypothetical protein K449DRAFT_427552 [Hypoxylon sp. EC38]